MKRGLTSFTPTALALAMLTVQVQADTNAGDSLEVITVTGYKQDVMNAPASISVIDAVELQNKAYRDVTQALQDVPGIFAENGPGSKGGTSEVSIRGMSSKYALILVNGKPQGSNQGYYNGY
ncbi:MAG: TonB-dependent receptor plug domain-containing protein, partial [Cellvibrionaceae bacterium]|nr:TonB-dependent receptor plug domain-containing protein [Cellvibrionaceae bacterium]